MSHDGTLAFPRKPEGSAHPHPAARAAKALVADCDFRTTRRSGPGGQNRNKVETAVILIHRPSGITAEAAERRSQGENRRVALFRLRLKLALSIRCPMPLMFPDQAHSQPGNYQPSPLWRSRLRADRIHVNPTHDDFPALLAEALDVLHNCDCDAKTAAACLKCTPSQLLKLLNAEPRALELVNEKRRQAGRPIYR